MGAATQFSCSEDFIQYTQCMHNVTLRHNRITVVAMEEQ